MLLYLNSDGPLSSIMLFPDSDCEKDANYKISTDENTSHFSTADTNHGQDPNAAGAKRDENTRCQLVKAFQHYKGGILTYSDCNKGLPNG